MATAAGREIQQSLPAQDTECKFIGAETEEPSSQGSLEWMAKGLE